MHAAKWSQKVPRCRPQPFNCVGVHFSHAISIVIACPFMLTVTDRAVFPLNRVVACPFIGVTLGRLLRRALHVLSESLAVRVLAHPPAPRPTLSADGADHRWPIIFIAPMSTPLVRSAPRRIQRSHVLVTFFPPRSETSRRFASHGLAVRSDSTSPKRSVGFAGASGARRAA